MTRAVMVGTNAYPFLILYWFEVFKTFWQDEVDRVYIVVSNPEHASTWDFVRRTLESHPKVKVIHTKRNWPDSINKGAHSVEEDLICFMHDDTLVLKRGIVEKYFDIVEKSGKVVTHSQPIYYPLQLVDELIAHQFPNAQYLNHCYSFYCNFFFINRGLFRNTCMDFGEWHVKVGEYCPQLDFTPKIHDMGADTNFKLALDLHSMETPFEVIPKQELSDVQHFPDPMEELKRRRDEGEGVFAPDAGYIHLQTMAYHIYGLYYDVGVRELLEKTTGGAVLPKIHEQGSQLFLPTTKMALTLRLAWLAEFMETCQYGGMGQYHNHAARELDYVRKLCKINKSEVKAYQQIFHKLVWRFKHE